MEPIRASWGRRIRRLRLAQGLSQEALAALVNLDQAAVSRWELGEAAPKDQHRPRIARALGVHPDFIFSYEPDPPNGATEAA